jgi:sulfatase modifying factor 1
MKNVLMKSHIMNNRMVDEKALIELNMWQTEYSYRDSQSIEQSRNGFEKIQVNKKNTIHLIPFKAENVYFNMISCPSGEVYIKNGIGIQTIKSPFMLGETEVTQDIFMTTMGFNYSSFKGPNKPVENVSWYDCVIFCNILSDIFGFDHCYKISNQVYGGTDAYENPTPLSVKYAKVKDIPESNGFRLPSEHEWQLASRAKNTLEYNEQGKIIFLEQQEYNICAGYDVAQLEKIAWTGDNSNNQTHIVSQKKPNLWGFYDMSGNVHEWCNNSHKHNKYLAKNEDESRVVRGGCWNDTDKKSFSSIHRMGYSPAYRTFDLGFRIARNMV